MSFLGKLFGKRSAQDTAQEIVTRLITIIVSLMADGKFSAAAPEVTAYLGKKKTTDLVNAVRGVGDLMTQAQAQGQRTLLNPEVIAHAKEALEAELSRRGWTRLSDM